jgi:hypothetical protein
LIGSPKTDWIRKINKNKCLQCFLAKGTDLGSNLLLWMPLGLQGNSEPLGACDRVRSFVRPVRAADVVPLAGMVMRGAGPNL